MEDINKGGRQKGMRGRHAPRGWRRIAWPAILATLSIVACAPALYSVNMKYIPTRAAHTFEKVAQPLRVTVAAFQDLRMIDDRVQIGRVVRSNGTVIPVLPKFVATSQAVTVPFKDFFQRAGFTVASETPPWDLKEESIKKEWGPILVGGSIDELEVRCINSLTVEKYTAKVKLTVLFATPKTGKIFYRVVTESTSTLEHVFFSEEKLEEQINTALSDAIEKIFEARETTDMIRKGINKY